MISSRRHRAALVATVLALECRRRAATSSEEAPSTINLAEKQRPFVERVCGVHGDLRRAAAAERPPLVVSLGSVDTSALRAALALHGDSLWSSPSVRVKRFGHDAWGVGKAVFVYCDDALTTAFSFPLSRREPWSSALTSVFTQLGVPEDRVVRCLLAKLPPGGVIPPHYDTGDWVGRVHRVHVPVVLDDPDSLHFLVGYGDESETASENGVAPLQGCGVVDENAPCAAVGAFRRVPPSRRSSAGLQRVDVREGEAFELNNIAVHCVENRGERGRVHLIFDYLPRESDGGAARLKSVALNEGDVLQQTRRTIERVSAPPFFVVLGAQKAGTTSLYEMICAHPDVARRARRKEPHFFDWRWPFPPGGGGGVGASLSWGALDDADALAVAAAERDALPRGDARNAWCAQWRGGLSAPALDALRVAYGCCFRAASDAVGGPNVAGRKCYGEATPSYLLGGRTVAARLRAVRPDAKLIVLLREPVARAQSHWAMLSDEGGSAAQRAHRGSDSLIASGAGGFARAVADDVARIEAMGADAYFRAAATGSRDGAGCIVGRGLYAAQLKQWLRWWPKSSILVLRLEDLKTTRGAQRTMDRVCDHLELPRFTIADSDARARNVRSYDREARHAATTVAQLAEFYREPEAELEALLREPGWAGVRGAISR